MRQRRETSFTEVSIRPVMRIWTGKEPMGWMTEGRVRVAVRLVGGKMRMLFLSAPGYKARWTMRGRSTVILSSMAVTAWAERR